MVLSVHTKDKDRPGKEGLVWQVYNQETCVTCTLHLSASGFLEQVNIFSTSLPILIEYLYPTLLGRTVVALDKLRVNCDIFLNHIIRKGQGVSLSVQSGVSVHL